MEKQSAAAAQGAAATAAVALRRLRAPVKKEAVMTSRRKHFCDSAERSGACWRGQMINRESRRQYFLKSETSVCLQARRCLPFLNAGCGVSLCAPAADLTATGGARCLRVTAKSHQPEEGGRTGNYWFKTVLMFQGIFLLLSSSGQSVIETVRKSAQTLPRNTFLACFQQEK